MTARIGILGGGISGLSLAYFLGADAEVLEKEDVCGGLCRTFEKDGFLFDQGGHALFSHDKEILELELSLLGENVVKHRRNSCIWFKGRPVKYPFENGLAALDKEDIFEILRDFLAVKPSSPANLEEWILTTFGRAMSEMYMLPYNRKIWKLEPSKMGLDFVERIPRPPVEDVLRSAIGIETEGYTFQLYYYYPARGGFESLTRAFESQVANVRKRAVIESIRGRDGAWEILLADGSTCRYEQLVSTVPIFELVPLLATAVPAPVVDAIERLRFNSLRVALVGAKKLLRPGYATVYVADPSSPAHRYCFSDGFSSQLAPPGCASIFAEATHPANTTPDVDDVELVRATIAWLAAEGFIDPADVVTTDVRSIRYAYPVYDLDYRASSAVMRSYFESIGIHLLGRFSQFLYINSDVCIKNARALSRRLRPT